MNQGWNGVAHDAAQNAFDRGFKSAAHVSDVCSAVASALTSAFHAVSRAKTDLLDVARAAEASGKFTVDDQWVVELAPIPWTADEIDEARAAQRAAQTVINERVIALAEADNPQTLLGAVKALGISPPGEVAGIPLPGSLPPADEAPNPANAVTGPLQQDTIRRQWEASTPRKVSEEHVPEHDGYHGYHRKTLEMQDGSRQVIDTVDPPARPWEENPNTARRDQVSVTTFDPSGNYVSTVSSYRWVDGTQNTETHFASGTTIVYTQTPSGTKTARIDVGGFSREIPADDALWKHPVSDTVGSALTGVEKGLEKSDDIPRVSAATASKVEVGARYAGPAVGIATSLLDVYQAQTLEDKCVAGASGTGGFVGGGVGGQVGAWVVGLATENPFMAGAGAAGGSLSGGWIGSYLGEKVGDVLCR
ncbi:hypothetical protein ACXVUM_13235 [Williamsia sp. SKLECPSW1]